MSQFSRNEWVYWDMYTMPIVGTVAYNDKTFVASFNMENNNQIIGELDTKRGLNGNIRVSRFFNYQENQNATKDMYENEVNSIYYR